MLWSCCEDELIAYVLLHMSSHCIHTNHIHAQYIQQPQKTTLAVMDKMILACKYFPGGSTHIWLATNQARFSWVAGLLCSTFPTFFILFQHYLAQCQLVAQAVPDGTFFFFFCFNCLWQTISKEKSWESFHLLSVLKAQALSTWEQQTQLHQPLIITFILKDYSDRLWNKWNVEEMILLPLTRGKLHFLHLLQMHPRAHEKTWASVALAAVVFLTLGLTSSHYK